jgi:4-amino-4-deoxy-L-arabinose transferase-like glycosyltransferase
MHHKILYGIIFTSLVIAVCTLTVGHAWGDDFASYIMQAQSIVQGKTQEFVEHNAFTIFESSFQIGPVAYPWGYPLILAPMYAIKGNSPLVLKLPNIILFAAFLVCLYVLLTSSLSRTESLLLVAVFAFNPLLLDFLDEILSDIPFLLFSTLALWLANKRVRAATEYALLGLVIAVAFFIRTTGFLLLASFLIMEFVDIWRNREDTSAKNTLRNILIVCGTFGLLWIIYALLFPGGGESYFAQYQALQLSTVLENSRNYFDVFSQFFGETSSWKYLYYLLCLFFLIGLWIRRKKETFFILFFALWMLLLITWPAWQGTRFILPVLPIFIYFTHQGISSVVQRVPAIYQARAQQAVHAFWIIIAVIFLFNSSRHAYLNLQNDRAISGAYDPYSREVYNYIKEKTSPENIVVFFKPRAMRLMTGHDALMSMECERILKGDILVLSRRVRIAENHQIPPEEIASCNLPLNEVFRNSRFIVYEIQK